MYVYVHIVRFFETTWSTDQPNKLFLYRCFYEAHNSALVDTVCSLISSQKTIFIEKWTIKIECAASTGNHGYYIKKVSFSWPPMVAAHDRWRSIAAEVADPTKTVLITRIQLCTSNPTMPFKYHKRRISHLLWKPVTFKGRGLKVLKYVYIRHRLFFLFQCQTMRWSPREVSVSGVIRSCAGNKGEGHSTAIGRRDRLSVMLHR